MLREFVFFFFFFLTLQQPKCQLVVNLDVLYNIFNA